MCLCILSDATFAFNLDNILRIPKCEDTPYSRRRQNMLNKQDWHWSTQGTQDIQYIPDCRGNLVRLALLSDLVLLECLELRGFLFFPYRQGVLAARRCLELPGCRAHRWSLNCLVPLGPLAPPLGLDCLALLLGLGGLGGLLPLGSLVLLGCLVPLDHPGHLDCLAPLLGLGYLAPLVCLALLWILDHQVLLSNPGFRATRIQDRRGCQRGDCQGVQLAAS